jgi:SAM-dependent methyltransferase
VARLRDLGRAFTAAPPRETVRSIARAPLELQATRLLDALPRLELADLTDSEAVTLTFGGPAGRHAWSLGFAEQLALQAIVSARRMTSAFEIGTFNGGTTRILAEALAEPGRVTTIDLPPAAFDSTQRPDGVTGAGVGAAYHDSPAADRVTQLLVDSLGFDAEPYAGQYDLVLVDGGHEYVHGIADTRTALRVVAPGGVIIWDDFTPYWHGLVRGICETMEGRRLARLAGTCLGVYLVPD